MSESPWWRIGWRNLGRHRKRTVITALGLAVGYFAVVFLVGWVEGITAEMVENATGLVSGQIEIHASEYRPERSLYETIGGREGTDVAQMLREIAADSAVVAAAPRVYAGGLVSSGESTSAGMFMGIDPQLEPTLSRFLDELSAGRLPEPGRNELVIGTEMARQLVAGVGDEVVVVAPGADGSMGNDLFRIAGIFRTGMAELDATFAVLHLGDLQTLVVLEPGRIHEVAVSTADPWIAADTAARLAANLAPADLGLEVAPWTELRPEMVEYVALAQSFYFVIFVVVFAIAIFGVANTMLMATFERRREFAVMLALGTTPRSVVLTVISEAFAMGLLSLLIGSAITFPLMIWWHNAPPDLSWLYGEVTMFGALLTPSLRVEYNLAVWLQSGVALVLTALLAALYPAVRAARVPPADTLSGL
ncbi:MAG: ABC transporter permease [Vicinamibacterales bacterium]|jgi:ABC-type lipoprotein release transport system permease subunit|nr:ABC transporter permease [Vicinamibacterales bacterium]